MVKAILELLEFLTDPHPLPVLPNTEFPQIPLCTLLPKIPFLELGGEPLGSLVCLCSSLSLTLSAGLLTGTWVQLGTCWSLSALHRGRSKGS